MLLVEWLYCDLILMICFIMVILIIAVEVFFISVCKNGKTRKSLFMCWFLRHTTDKFGHDSEQCQVLEEYKMYGSGRLAKDSTKLSCFTVEFEGKKHVPMMVMQFVEFEINVYLWWLCNANNWGPSLIREISNPNGPFHVSRVLFLLILLYSFFFFI